MKKKYFAVIIIVLIIGVLTGYKVADKADAVEECSLEFYQQLIEELDIIKIYDSSKLTTEILQNRNGEIIIEKCIGEVTSSTGDGRILNYDNPNYYYINYSKVDGIKKGNVVLTYFIYNPDSNFEDDILLRFDYIIDGKEVE